MARTQDKARALIASILKLDEEEVTPEKYLMNDLGADSLDIVEVLMMLEREFNIKFDEDDNPKIKTVGDLYELIEKYTLK